MANSLELAKRAVGLQHLAERDQSAHLAAIANEVVSETVQQHENTVMASDHRSERVRGCWHLPNREGWWRASVLERGEALIRFEGLRELDDAGHVPAGIGEFVAAQTVVKARTETQTLSKEALDVRGC